MELRKLGLQTCSCPNFRPSLQIPLLARQATDPPSRWPSATWCYLCTKAPAVWGTLSANLFKRLPFPGQEEPFNKNLLRTKNKVSCGRPGATSPLWRSTGKQSDDGTAARRFCWVLGWRCIAKKCPSSLWVGFCTRETPQKKSQCDNDVVPKAFSFCQTWLINAPNSASASWNDKQLFLDMVLARVQCKMLSIVYSGIFSPTFLYMLCCMVPQIPKTKILEEH